MSAAAPVAAGRQRHPADAGLRVGVIAAVVVGVAGLNDHYQARRIGRVRPKAATTGPVGGFTPGELKSAYDVAPLAALGYRGQGQPLGLLELDGFNQGNINVYDSQYGLATVAPTVVLVDTATGTPGAGQVEVELDIEVMHAIAPSAPITVWEGPNSDLGVLHTYNAMVLSDSTPSNSTSWGLCEPSTSPSMMLCISKISNMAARISGSAEMRWSASPTIRGRIAAALANSTAA